MTNNQKSVCYAVLVVLLLCCGMFSYVSIKNYEKEAQINAQTEVEKSKIEQEEKTKRTQERMKWLPWFSKE